MKKLMYVLGSFFCLLACQKKVVSKGVVYSKYNYPLTNITVVMSEYKSGKDAALTSKSTQTDNNGEFIFNFSTAKNRYFSLDISCDSGWIHKESLDREQLKNIDLYLH